MIEFLKHDWVEVLMTELKKESTLELFKKVKALYFEGINVLPKKEEVFNAFQYCEFENLKVVIIGQDPYPNKTHAHGLCFSVKKNVKPFPKSLNNIFKEIKSDIGIELPDNGNLERWAKQGVFLLNTILTINEGETNSHKKIGWKMFTDDVIRMISNKKEKVVFILWGSQAHKMEALIDDTKHLILKSVHPSPLSAYRGFYGCKHFSKTNTFLKQNNLEEINW